MKYKVSYMFVYYYYANRYEFMSRIAHYLNETYSLFIEQPGKITPTEENTQDNKEYLMGEIPPHFIDCNIVEFFIDESLTKEELIRKIEKFTDYEEHRIKDPDQETFVVKLSWGCGEI